MKELLVLAFIALAGFTANAQKVNITLKELPAAAQSFISANFPNQASSYVIKDKGMLEIEYKVILAGGVEIEFDADGNWEEIESNTPLPATVLPETIAGYINSNYKSHGTLKVEKKRQGYEVELTNGTELEFDTKGKFLRIDN